MNQNCYKIEINHTKFLVSRRRNIEIYYEKLTDIGKIRMRKQGQYRENSNVKLEARRD